MTLLRTAFASQFDPVSLALISPGRRSQLVVAYRRRTLNYNNCPREYRYAGWMDGGHLLIALT